MTTELFRKLKTLNMLLSGLVKTTLIDYPKKIACIVFTQGCNFRCSFCHNPSLIPIKREENAQTEEVTEESFFEFLNTRKGKLDGVSITGGEPTLQQDLQNFMKKIKDMGFLVKLDSNGSNPQILKEIIEKGLVDYIAMDIKHTREKYPLAMGRKLPIERIEESVELIMNSGIDYEFRTTVVPTIHAEEDFVEIAKWIKGAKNYYLQEYRDVTTLDKTLPQKTQGKTLDLDKIKQTIEKDFGFVGVRR